jgi:hypothetical protein
MPSLDVPIDPMIGAYIETLIVEPIDGEPVPNEQPHSGPCLGCVIQPRRS